MDNGRHAVKHFRCTKPDCEPHSCTQLTMRHQGIDTPDELLERIGDAVYHGECLNVAGTNVSQAYSCGAPFDFHYEKAKKRADEAWAKHKASELGHGGEL